YVGAAVLRVAIVVGVVLVALIVLVSVIPMLRRRAALARFRQDRDAAHAAYLANLDRWHDRIAAHDEAERRRIEAATRWFPLTSWSQPERIDMFVVTVNW